MAVVEFWLCTVATEGYTLPPVRRKRILKARVRHSQVEPVFFTPLIVSPAHVLLIRVLAGKGKCFGSQDNRGRDGRGQLRFVFIRSEEEQLAALDRSADRSAQLLVIIWHYLMGNRFCE